MKDDSNRRGSRKRAKKPTSQASETTTPMTIRPRDSVKELAEALAEQLRLRRSKLDSDIYELGALLLGASRVSPDQQIGTLSRKAAARKLRPVLQPLFELLLQEGEMPLLFNLLLGSAAARAGVGPAEGGDRHASLLPDPAAAQRTYEAFSSTAAEQAVQGFPEEV
jgi:hypothetical protein